MHLHSLEHATDLLLNPSL